MSTTKMVGLIALVVLVTAASGVVGYQLGRRSGQNNQEPAATETADGGAATEVAPVADVQTATVTTADITKTLTAYGTVVAKPTAHQSVIVPTDVKLVRLLVVAGQHVNANDPVADVVPTADTALALEEAQSAADAADAALKGVQGRYDLKLATNQDLQAAQAAAKDAHLKLTDMLRRSADKGQTLKATESGVVDKIEVAPGQILPAGTVLIQINDTAQTEVRIGVDPRLIHLLTVGEALKMAPTLNMPAEVKGTIRQLVDQVDPDTRLADILVTLPENQHWMIGTPVTAAFGLTQPHAIVVPRSAVLPDDGQEILYTVVSEAAVKHMVEVGIQNDQDVEILKATPELKDGDIVVVEGNYELEDAMRVRVVAKP